MRCSADLSLPHDPARLVAWKGSPLSVYEVGPEHYPRSGPSSGQMLPFSKLGTSRGYSGPGVPRGPECLGGVTPLPLGRALQPPSGAAGRHSRVFFTFFYFLCCLFCLIFRFFCLCLFFSRIDFFSNRLSSIFSRPVGFSRLFLDFFLTFLDFCSTLRPFSSYSAIRAEA